MSETERGDQMIAEADRGMSRANRYALIGKLALAGLIAAILGIQIYGYLMGQEREREINALQEQATQSDTAAVEVAEEKRSQAQSIRELCESGAIEQDPAGQAVCDEAARTAAEDPEAAVASAKGDRGPEGARGPAGAAGTPGTDGTDGTDGDPGAAGPAGTDGSPGTPGADGTDGDDGDPGTAGEPGSSGADGKNGSAGTAGNSGSPGSAGAKGDAGATGPKGDTGPAGPAGDTGPPGPAGPAGKTGADGSNGNDGRGIADAQCGPDGRWQITYTDDSTRDAGPCLVTPETPDPTPTAPEEETP